MIQLFVVFSFLIWVIALLGFGCFVSVLIKRYLEDFEITPEFKILYYGILGLIVISIIGTIFNFFIPLNYYFSLVILLLGIILFISYRKNIIASYTWMHFLIFFLLFIYSCLLSLKNLKGYDTLLYHLPMVNWISNLALPFGLANLHTRFGFNSSWFIDASIIYPLRLITNSPFFIINAIVSFFYGTFIFATLSRIMKDNRLHFSTAFALTTFIPWFYYLVGLASSLYPDVPVMLLTLFVTFLLIKSFETKNADCLFISLIISFYIVTIKLSAIPYFLGFFLILILFFIFKKISTRTKEIIPKNLNYIQYIFTFIILLIMGLPYLIRNLVSSGYIAFPSAISYVNLKWSVPIKSAVSNANWVRSWARKPGLNPNDVLGNWDWLIPWFNNITNDKILVCMAIFGFLIALFCFIFKKRRDLDIFLIVSFLSLSGCLFWFFTAPDPRFGYGYLFSFFGTLVSYGIYNFIDKEKSIKYFLKFICFAIFLVFLYQNNISLKEISNTSKVKDITFIERKTKEEIIISTPKKGDQCSDGPLLSTPYFNENLKIIFDKNNNPRMFYFEE